jgi:hypothetical protein
MIQAEEFERLPRVREPESLVEFLPDRHWPKSISALIEDQTMEGRLNCERISPRHQRSIRTRVQEARAEGGAVDPKTPMRSSYT